MSFLRKKAFTSQVVAKRVSSGASRTARGRPFEKERRNVADMIGEISEGGQEIIRYMYNTMKGITEDSTPAVRMAAATWLGNYYFGRPVETTVQLSMSRTHDSLPGLTDEQLEEILRGGLSQGLRGGDSPGPDTVELRLDETSVGTSNEGDVAVSEVRPEVLRQGAASEVSDGETVSEVADLQSDGGETPGTSDGPSDGEAV